MKIAGRRFDHAFFRRVLTHGNVESESLRFSESLVPLSAGIQKAFWEFGGVPDQHRSDSLAAAVRNHASRKELTERYAALMTYYNCVAEPANARRANENGDVESSNWHLKDRIEQALMLRGSQGFASREEYVAFVEELVKLANDNRRQEFLHDLARLNPLPDQRLDADDIVAGLHVSDIHLEAPDLREFDSLLATFDKECPNHDQANLETSGDEGHESNSTSNASAGPGNDIRPDVATHRP